MLHGDERLPNGIIHHSDRHPNDIKKVAVTCLRCNKKRYVLIPRGKQRENEGWTGACHACAMGVRKETWRHPNGALILWGERVRGQKHLVPFICLNCGEKKIVRASQVYTKAKRWLGWCGDCIEARGSITKVNGDVELKPWGSWIYFSQAIGKQVPVKCGLCGRIRQMHRTSVLSNYQKGMTGYCSDSRECNRTRIDRESGNGEKRSPGREPVITEEKVIEAFNKLGPYAPQEKLSEHLGVDPRSFRDWHKKQGLTYRQCRQRYSKTGGN